jgi:hypothetical protein
MGDIQTADGNDADGLYGFKDGVNRFRLTEKGEFYAGNERGSKIHLDAAGNLEV